MHHSFTTQEILQLSYVQGITSHGLRKIVEHFHTFRALRAASPRDMATMRLRAPTLEAMRDAAAYEDHAARQLALAARHGARVLSIWEEGYPPLLREIYNPPAFLFVKGDITPDDTQAVAIVGTRAMTEYGRRVTEAFARQFAERAVTVVSGLARGIDSVAHATTLRHHGRTIAVVASGLDQISPNIARQLADKICGAGAVISEYKMGTKALPSFFPQRNRIISGVSMGTLVVESAIDGGAMITAGFAIDQNRDVFAVPGRTFDPKSAGTNHLIRESRAKLVENTPDVLADLGIVHAPLRVSASAPTDLSLFERRVYESLTDEPRHVDDIAESVTLAPHDVLVNLLMLELKGLARQTAGKRFMKER